ncbi:MAG TPA: shikimate kinase [Acidimicrobiales bacterium]|nr:shikimate kinase [Acidimicrobiales bacterium]
MAEPASSIVLVGMMAAGKSSVGRRLAQRRGWEFFDSDRQIEAITGRTVADIWRAEGEPAFRRIEAQVLADALASTTPRVIAAAGGTVLDPQSRRLIGLHHPVVWLRARPETLAERVTAGSAAHRPLLDGDAAGTLARLDAARRPFYAEVADISVDVDDLTAEQVAACVEAALDHGGPAPESPNG